MFVVTNTISVETEHADKIIKKFTAGHTKEAMADVDGFLSLQLLQRELPSNSEVTEVIVMSTWTSKGLQKQWVASQTFKKLHRRDPKTNKPNVEENKRSGVLGNVIAEYYTVTP